MNKNRIVIFISVVILAVSGFFLFRANSKDVITDVSTRDSSSNQSAGVAQDNKGEENADVKLTKEEVAKHSSANDCWIIIDGVVYDLTSFISRHPGGSEILRACGIDGTSLFKQRETSSGESIGSGTPHSSSAQSQLEQFKLGNLEQ